MPSKNKAEKWETEEVLQAVVLADSFDVRFAPFTFNRPRALLPLGNAALIDYTLHFLVASGVQEIYVMCKAFAAEIKAHIDKSVFARTPGVRITTRISQSFSVGECLREIDTMDIIKKDFILVSGDVLSNMVLTPTLEEHKERFKKDKSSIMTMLFKAAQPGHHMRCPEDDIAVALDTKGRLIAYETPENGVFGFPQNACEKAGAAQVRYDLLDCQIYICSQDVLMTFTDEFDCESMYDFVRFMLNEEAEAVHGRKVHAAVIGDAYAARISNFNHYDAVSKDLLSRWTYPVVPEMFQNRDRTIKYSRNNIYLNDTVTLTRGCVLEENVLVGEGTTIGREAAPITTISNCVIGRNCKIGAGVKLSNVYIWDDVVIEDDCTIDQAILADGVCMKHEVTVKPGSLFDFNVVVGPSIVIEAGTRISLKKGDGDDDFEDSEDEENDSVIYDPDEVGKEGEGFIWVPEEDDDMVKLLTWGIAQEEEDFESDGESFNGSESEYSDEESDTMDNNENDDPFLDEILDLVNVRVMGQGRVPIDELALEISGSRSAYNKSIPEVVKAVTTAVIMTTKDESKNSKEQATATTKVFSKIAAIFSKYVSSERDQTSFLLAIEDACIEYEVFPSFQTLVHAMYEHDDEIISEEVILKWFNSSEDLSGEQQRIRKHAAPFIQWLEEADEESEDSDSD